VADCGNVLNTGLFGSSFGTKILENKLISHKLNISRRNIFFTTTTVLLIMMKRMTMMMIIIIQIVIFWVVTV
jgi:hypothetical protein